MFIELDENERSLLPGEPQNLALLRESPNHRVLRVHCAGSSFILKSFHSAPVLELQVYALLDSLDVPVLPLLARSDQALLLEDLETSPGWRLAVHEDMGLSQTGEALATWYQHLHQAGFQYLSQPQRTPPFLTSWIDEINLPELRLAGEKFGFSAEQGWHSVLEHLEPLKSAYRVLPQTFNYNDFSWVNLALSRTQSPFQAVVFDYDCFSLGTAYSDCRNVMYALSGAGLKAFVDRYGPLDLASQRLDDPLSTLHGLVIAAGREHFPNWARSLVEAVRQGELARQVRLAL
jgi:hypothetical protein